jgi:mannose-6-phosphate isomerase-like protein (cupin superfamily)
MNVRRIVTATTPTGAAVVSDGDVRPITAALLGGGEFHSIWGSDAPPELPSDGQRPDAKAWFPPPGGFRFGLVTLGPDAVALPEDFDLGAALTELEQKLPGMVDVLEPDNPGMHRSDTVDYVVVLSGHIWLELDNGEQTLVRAGDTVVQNGTRHAWRNTSDEPCVMAVALVGASRRG